jgi:hypothetical protein
MTPAAPGSSTAQRYHGASSSTSQQKPSASGQKFVVFVVLCRSLLMNFY